MRYELPGVHMGCWCMQFSFLCAAELSVGWGGLFAGRGRLVLTVAVLSPADSRAVGCYSGVMCTASCLKVLSLCCLLAAGC